MTDGVVSLRPDVELSEFFDYIYGEQVGYVYAPLKGLDEDNPTWDTKFFEWPRQRTELVNHVLTNAGSQECYYGPALYAQPDVARPENILGANVVWAEFDGNAPQTFGDKIPHPSMRVQSSNKGHEHLYWKLDEFETDRNLIETINRSIAYTLNADTSGWDSTQILRPPTTKNHKRGKLVRILTSTTFSYSRDYFAGVPVPKRLVKENIQIEEVPDALDVVAKYKWSAEEFQFFRKTTMEPGTRSSALMRLAYNCAEMRMSDEEAFAIMFNADERWGKFRGRRDQSKRLLDMINRARLKYPIDPEVAIDKFEHYNWKELLDLEVHIEWMIPGILQRQGLMLISGPPGVGKTQLSLQFLIHMACGKNLFDWEMGPPRKVSFFSMEMGVTELKYIMGQMDAVLTPEEKDLVYQNFNFVPIGYGVLMDTTVDQKKIVQYLEEVKPEIIVFDSLSTSSTDDLTEERVAKKVFDFANHIRMDHDVAVCFIHHNRKAQTNNKKPNQLSDVYGSFIITSQPTTVIGMWMDHKSDDIELMFLKVRLAKAPDKLIVRRHEGLVFKQAEPTSLIAKASAFMKEEDDARKRNEPDVGPGQANLSL
jgi:archaellum biogenesis ATPase FlaH